MKLNVPSALPCKIIQVRTIKFKFLRRIYNWLLNFCESQFFRWKSRNPFAKNHLLLKAQVKCEFWMLLSVHLLNIDSIAGQSFLNSRACSTRGHSLLKVASISHRLFHICSMQWYSLLASASRCSLILKILLEHATVCNTKEVSFSHHNSEIMMWKRWRNIAPQKLPMAA